MRFLLILSVACSVSLAASASEPTTQSQIKIRSNADDARTKIALKRVANLAEYRAIQRLRIELVRFFREKQRKERLVAWLLMPEREFLAEAGIYFEAVKQKPAQTGFDSRYEINCHFFRVLIERRVGAFWLDRLGPWRSE